ncbi:MAG: 4-(cytidine 5'-diphospho)-2-C-methyl-D-erythritol kinase [Frankiaceae bacterium]|nr:4-(cytidine 5'-diphospho)-2-C-methyl-D-erythritol kinase [Arenimonas sp.]
MTVDPRNIRSTWPAPAKLNLFLRIVGRRADGYHQLQTVFQLLDWGDEVSLRVRPDGQIRREGGDTLVFDESEDLLVRAAHVLKQATGSPLGVELSARKSIPAGGGFGGGSSDAATVLVALNHLWRTGLDETALAGLGLELGADVPVFIFGRNAWAEGVGERLTAIPLAPAWFVVVEPGVGASTRQLFQAPELTRDAAPATIADFASGAALGNAFEPVLRRLQPAVDTALSALAPYGQACLTGTGSGCFVRFNSESEAMQARFALPASMKSRVVAGVEHSPLLDALAKARSVAG